MNVRSLNKKDFPSLTARNIYSDLPEVEHNDDDDDDEGDFLTWRSDPDHNYSDWTIIVTAISRFEDDQNDDQDDDQEDDHDDVRVPAPSRASRMTPATAVYHVHRCVLGAPGTTGSSSSSSSSSYSPRCSEYFRAAFRRDRFAESADATSRVELERSAFDAFPAFLDHLYRRFDGRRDARRDVDLTVDNATALRHLGVYFGVADLVKIATNFVREDVDSFNVDRYCREALVYRDADVLDCVTRELAASATTTTTSGNGRTPTEMAMKMLPPERQMEVLRIALENSQEENARLRDELARFKRVPHSWRTRLSSDEVEPTVVPESHRSLDDDHHQRRGSVFRFKGSDKVCPVFYYDDH